MPNLSKVTKDHDVIRGWAEERGAKPSHVKRTGSAEDVGVLRFDFPGYSGEDTLEPITWEQFFEKLDQRNLALLYEEETAGGQKSNFNKIVGSETTVEVEQPAKTKPAKTKPAKSNRGKGAKKPAASKKSAVVAKRPAPAKKTAKKAAKKTMKRPSRPAAKKAGSKRPVKKATAKKVVKKTSAKKTASKKATSRGAAKRTPAKKSSRGRRR